MLKTMGGGGVKAFVAKASRLMTYVIELQPTDMHILLHVLNINHLYQGCTVA